MPKRGSERPTQVLRAIEIQVKPHFIYGIHQNLI